MWMERLMAEREIDEYKMRKTREKRVEAGSKSEWEVERGEEKVEERSISLLFFSVLFSLFSRLSLLASCQLSRSQTTICLLERSEQPSTYFYSSFPPPPSPHFPSYPPPHSSHFSLSLPPLPSPHETLPLHSDGVWEKENQTEPTDRQDANTLIC